MASMVDRIKSRRVASVPPREPLRDDILSRGLKAKWTDAEDRVMLNLVEKHCAETGAPNWRLIYNLPAAREALKRHIPINAPNTNTKHLFKRLKHLLRSEDREKQDRAANVLSKCLDRKQGAAASVLVECSDLIRID